MRRVLVTGGAGFIGGWLVRVLAASAERYRVTVLDKLTYASDLSAIAPLIEGGRIGWLQGDVGDAELVSGLLAREQFDWVIHLAAESHVDRSIDQPDAFVMTNVVGTYRLLDAVLPYWETLPDGRRDDFRFLQVSTDEVFGPADEGLRFDESAACRPSSPYAASKAAADHWVRAYQRTYGLPVLLTHGCNTYGPHQYPEKMIPVMILAAIAGQPLPVYGDGRQVREWIYVTDHCRALECVVSRGQVGQAYNVGSGQGLVNLDVVHAICDSVERITGRGESEHGSLRRSICHVPDRPGHDRRYAIDSRKIREQLGWSPRVDFGEGLERTVRWFVEHGARIIGQRIGLRGAGSCRPGDRR